MEKTELEAEFDKYFESHPLPKTKEETLKWSNHFYQYEPVVRDFLDALWSPMQRPPSEEEVAFALTPFFKLLVYRDFLRQKQHENNRA